MSVKTPFKRIWFASAHLEEDGGRNSLQERYQMPLGNSACHSACNSACNSHQKATPPSLSFLLFDPSSTSVNIKFRTINACTQILAACRCRASPDSGPAVCRVHQFKHHVTLIPLSLSFYSSTILSRKSFGSTTKIIRTPHPPMYLKTRTCVCVYGCDTHLSTAALESTIVSLFERYCAFHKLPQGRTTFSR